MKASVIPTSSTDSTCTPVAYRATPKSPAYRICPPNRASRRSRISRHRRRWPESEDTRHLRHRIRPNEFGPTVWQAPPRSEEHTSELQSRENLVCRLLLEKKN